MKTWYTKLFGLIAVLLAFTACEKDEERLVLRPGTGTMTVTPSAQSVTLSSSNAANEALRFSWPAADYGFNAAVNYVLQFARAGSNFTEPAEVTVGNALQKAFTVSELNALLLRLGLVPGTPAQVQVRVKSDVNPSVTPVYSGTTTITATPYLSLIQYPSLYVPGSYQNWAPATAAKIASVRDNKVYEGYVNFTEATTEFKLTDAPNWDSGIFGAAAGAAAGLASPGDNLKVTGPGYYLLKADLNANTWSATRTTWGLIGSGTSTGWDSDLDMTYDAATGTWRITTDLKEGEIKFRANDAWTINLGDTKADGLLEYEGENIKITSAGRYLVTLNLGNAGNYSYTLTKQ
ncbi:hypothetical protein GCM10023189_47950 [Nibrella saemangeumensis]|uniref:SusE outer membrane protein domain-containing protein n=1 Tax=Nibrella saemangeumensis TaxID=1084526 RepID=A0ABP8NJ65_9BACT